MTAGTNPDIAYPVQRQLDAYNARDIDAFMEWWADDCLYYAFPDHLLARGAAEIRERHVVRFREPNLHGRLLGRMVVDTMVVDHETVTRTLPGGPGEIDVVAIYEVERDRIARAWFKIGPSRLFSDAVMRRGQPCDADAVRTLTRAAYAGWVPVIGREPLPMGADYDVRVRKHIIDILQFGGRPVALIEMVPRDGHLLIENVAVLPDFQGRGFGRRLLAHAETVAVTLGLREMRLYTNSLFAANLALYGRLGYREERREAFEGGVAVHMRKSLAAAP